MLIGRRRLVTALGAGILAPAALARAQVSPTPGETLGPFYPVRRPDDADFDMTRVAGRSGRAAGDVMELTGRVMQMNGQPAAGATVEIWQANAGGRYDHPSDTSRVPLDPNFHGFALVKADSEGRFRVLTIKPGAYVIPSGQTRTPHVHFQVSTATDRLVTQMYFPAETLNEQDFLFASMKRRLADPSRVIASAVAASQPGIKAYDWLIVI
jgi:protocatechuate 3,4-dioxygenase, beta subunit